MAKPKNAKAKQDVSVEKKEEKEVVKRGKFEFSDGCLVYEGDYITIEASADPNEENVGENGAEHKPIIMRHGHGSQQGNGESYVGQWFNDAIHGIGRYSFASGATYEGEFSHNRFHGKGVFTFADRSLYDGEWVDNRMQGDGVFSDSAGNSWHGKFHNDTFLNESGSWVPVTSLAQQAASSTHG